MKTRNILTGLIILALAFAMHGGTLAQGKAKAKGGPPPWAPAHGYRAQTKHIYFPEYNVYYDVQRNVYISMSNGKWQVGVSLPSPLAKLDLKNSVQVELDLNTSSPQKYNDDHVAMYKGKGKNKDKAKGGPPPWAPAHGYRAQTKHIYFPEHNVYYDIQRNVYISMSNGKWQVGVSLPAPLAKVDLKNSVQVELDLNTSSPQKYNDDHIAMYKGKGKSKSKGEQVAVKTEPVKPTKTTGPAQAKGKKK